ncbi:WhiB family transcriptional regulator [Streptomyces sp. NPDC051664]|uniref:WhiB family transcriptional regulator n=1 Tax=Streptomyces sp. NPDC051664 TaxID=3365668 RepID=UPI0037B9B498
MDWRLVAQCGSNQEDPELFFPIGNTGSALTQLQQAKEVCDRCDVTADCLDWATETMQEHGVWGGRSEEERRAQRRRRLREQAANRRLSQPA